MVVHHSVSVSVCRLPAIPVALGVSWPTLPQGSTLVECISITLVACISIPPRGDVLFLWFYCIEGKSGYGLILFLPDDPKFIFALLTNQNLHGGDYVFQMTLMCGVLMQSENYGNMERDKNASV